MPDLGRFHVTHVRHTFARYRYYVEADNNQTVVLYASKYPGRAAAGSRFARLHMVSGG